MRYDDWNIADILAPAILLSVFYVAYATAVIRWERGAEETCARVAAAETRTAPPAIDFPDPCLLDAVTCDGGE